MGMIVPTCWTNVGPTYHCCLGKLHTTEPAHHRATGLCAARWCAARLCVFRLGCVEGHPWTCLGNTSWLNQPKVLYNEFAKQATNHWLNQRWWNTCYVSPCRSVLSMSELVISSVQAIACADPIVSFHNDFSPSGKQPKQRISVHKL